MNKKADNENLLDHIFRDPEIKHGLRIFKVQELRDCGCTR